MGSLLGHDVSAALDHPRGASTYARILGKYVREERALSLMDALRKSSLMPAQRLEGMSPQMRQKGRIKIGADADLSVFDPVRVIDKATYANPARYSDGFRYVPSMEFSSFATENCSRVPSRGKGSEHDDLGLMLRPATRSDPPDGYRADCSWVRD